MRILITVVAAVVFAQNSGVAYAELVFNGDFSSGNIGFVTGYTFVPAPNTSALPGTYAIRTNPQNFNSAFPSFGDHTSGTGNMLLLDGVGSTTAWQQTITVDPNTTYAFSAWGTSIFAPLPATLQFTANGITLGPDLVLTPNPGVWQNFSASWNSGATTSLTLRIFNLNPVTSQPGNDFALDDISLTAVPEPSSIGLLLVGTACFLVGRCRKSAVVS